MIVSIILNRELVLYALQENRNQINILLNGLDNFGFSDN